MLVGHKAPLYARYPPAPCLAINIRGFSIFWSKRQRIDPIGTSGHEKQGSGHRSGLNARRRSLKLRLVVARTNPKGGLGVGYRIELRLTRASHPRPERMKD
jgi:hypothetical protein